MNSKSVDWQIVDNYVNKYIDTKIQTAIVLSTKQTAALAAGDARRNAPVRSGDLKRSISAKAIFSTGGNTAIIYKASVPYARKQNYEHKTKKHYFTNAVDKANDYLEKQISENLDKIT